MKKITTLGTLAFAEMTLLLVEFNSRAWLALTDLARALEHKNPCALLKLIRMNWELFNSNTWLLDADKCSAESADLFTPGIRIESLRRRKHALYLSSEGVLCCLLFMRNRQATSFKIFLAKTLLPAMLRKSIQSANPLEAIPAKDRAAYLHDTAAARLTDARRKQIKSVLHEATDLLKEALKLRAAGENESVKQIVTVAQDYIETLREKRDGPSIF